MTGHPDFEFERGRLFEAEGSLAQLVQANAVLLRKGRGSLPAGTML
jgi:hypothetical protein